MPKQILLVDDSVTIHRVVQITFAREDYAITAVKTGDEGIARARDLKPDLVLADAGLSGKTGYDVVAAVKGDPATASVPCLLLTGNFSPYDEGKGQKAGADGFVVKPFETQALIDKVNDLVKKGGGARPATGAVAAAAPPAPAVTAAPPKPPVPTAVPIPAPPKPVIEPLSKPLSVVAQETAPKPPGPVPIPQPAPPRPQAPGQERRTMMGFPAVTPPAPPPPLAPPPAPEPVKPIAAPMPIPAPVAPAPPARTENGGMGAAMAAAAEAQPVMPAEVPQMPRPSMIPHTPTPQPKGAAAKSSAAQPRATLMGIPAVNPSSLGIPPGAVPLPPTPVKPAAWSPPAAADAGRPAPAPTPAPFSPPVPAPAPAASSAVAQAVNEISARGPEYAALAHLSREVIEKIAWEIVPDLAEIIIKDQLDRLVKERQG